MKKFLIVLLLLGSGLLGFIFSFYRHQATQLTDEHLIETFHYPALFVKQIEGDPQAGRKIFKEFCAACHASQPQIDINAPHIGDKKTWQSLSQLGIPALLKITINGAGAMPARGGCFECSDEQLRQTISYILAESLK